MGKVFAKLAWSRVGVNACGMLRHGIRLHFGIYNAYGCFVMLERHIEWNGIGLDVSPILTSNSRSHSCGFSHT